MVTSGLEHIVYLSLGSNLGDRARNLEKGIALIGQKIGRIMKQSGMHESGAWGYESENMFYNMCIEVKTGISPEGVMEHILGIEREMGRQRSGEGYADRLIDIDLLFYGRIVLDTNRLKLPHPGIPARRFVLVPLKEIAAEFVHPAMKISVAELLDRCEDRSNVEPV